MKKKNIKILELKNALLSLKNDGYYQKKNFLSRSKASDFLKIIKKIYVNYKNKNVPLAHERDKSDKIIYVYFFNNF